MEAIAYWESRLKAGGRRRLVESDDVLSASMRCIFRSLVTAHKVRAVAGGVDWGTMYMFYRSGFQAKLNAKSDLETFRRRLEELDYNVVSAAQLARTPVEIEDSDGDWTVRMPVNGLVKDMYNPSKIRAALRRFKAEYSDFDFDRWKEGNPYILDDPEFTARVVNRNGEPIGYTEGSGEELASNIECMMYSAGWSMDSEEIKRDAEAAAKAVMNGSSFTGPNSHLTVKP